MARVKLQDFFFNWRVELALIQKFAYTPDLVCLEDMDKIFSSIFTWVIWKRNENRKPFVLVGLLISTTTRIAFNKQLK